MSTAPLVRLPASIALAVVGGLVLWLAYPPVAFGPAAVAGIALITAALWGARVRRGLGVGLLAGLAFFLPLLAWMQVIGADAWIALSLLCGAWIALAGVGTALTSRLPWAPVWIAASWVLAEGLRARIPWGGFPWGNVSYSQVDGPLANWAALAGAPFVTFVVALIGAALVALARAAGARRLRPAAGWLAVIVVSVVGSLLVPIPTTGDDVGGAPEATIAIVQGGTPQVGMGAMDVRRAVLDNHVRATLDLAQAIDAGSAPRPDFVLWPENSTDIDPFADPSVADAITAAAGAVGAPILVGAVTTVPGRDDAVWNVGIVWDPVAGPTQMYIKTHPVPFGEYVPFRGLLSRFIQRFDRVPRDFLGGDRPGNLQIGGIEVGDVICFEIAYSEVVDAVVQGGARVLTVQTNNATYGGTAQPAQQLQIERLRATEFGRTVLVAATSGISAVIHADRSVQQQLDEDQTGWLVADVPLRGSTTPASVIGSAVEWLLILAALVAAAVSIVVARRTDDS
ncbi:MAG: apolipoprotein N-acyltransferase [Actinomycetales bacterium]|nr:apolipoprotein N-acyltransferase [Actinomycetales bacterium]